MIRSRNIAKVDYIWFSVAVFFLTEVYLLAVILAVDMGQVLSDKYIYLLIFR